MNILWRVKSVCKFKKRYPNKHIDWHNVFTNTPVASMKLCSTALGMTTHHIFQDSLAAGFLFQLEFNDVSLPVEDKAAGETSAARVINPLIDKHLHILTSHREYTLYKLQAE